MISRVLADRYEICQQLGRNARCRDPAGRPANSTTPYPTEAHLTDGRTGEERELFPDRGWVHLTPPPIATAPRRQETGFLLAILLFER
ncbi:MAG: hypothetical protein GDA48_10145 [Hormoscilla sp. GM102CHS1]|nr:hypothetical protein [Hormoscilla sp. GM102CHS1]